MVCTCSWCTVYPHLVETQQTFDYVVMFLQERQNQLFLTMVQIEKEKLIKANHLLTSALCLIN